MPYQMKGHWAFKDQNQATCRSQQSLPQGGNLKVVVLQLEKVGRTAQTVVA